MVAEELKKPAGKPVERRRILRIVGKFVGWVLALLGAITTFNVFYPSVSVGLEGPANPDLPVSVSVNIKNTTQIRMPVTNVKVFLGLCQIKFMYRGFESSVNSTDCETHLAYFADREKDVKILHYDETDNFRFDDIIKNIVPPESSLTSAIISVKVLYNVPIIPYDFPTEFGFKGRLEANGKLSWAPIPMEK
ncbi:hypothetical protein [Methylocella tundrae]|uniref:hypothetical protein n=1 Tax=Methylocella tundrae TaxID=227605 RepID=UPI00106A61F3|nr:hypothetical protein [Methylocella tundrae]WPP05412.1 hypothetical protein SIN04_06170 [Methylocella tundrae]